MREVSLSLCELFQANFGTGPLGFRGAVTVDGVDLKAKGAHCYDLTVHYMEFIEKSTFNKVDFRIKARILLLLD